MPIMKKRFVGKKSKKRTGVKCICFLCMVLFFFLLTYHILINHWKSTMTKEEVLDKLLKNGMGQNEFYNFLEMNPTEYLFSSAMGISIPKSESVFEEEDESGPVYEYVPDPIPKNDNLKPLIYIYNTHQTEGYSKTEISEYDIVPTVLFASYYLREKLNDYSLPTLVEANDISEVLRVNNWNYASSYLASRYLFLDALEKNTTLNYFLDIHRDSAGYNSSTTEYQGKKYAKILFVIGKEHPGYEKNLNFANSLNEKLKLKIPTISRGVIGKEGKNVNGIYNQDIHPNTLLIEVGGKDNSLGEVTNTMEVLATVLKEYIEEQNS